MEFGVSNHPGPDVQNLAMAIRPPLMEGPMMIMLREVIGVNLLFGGGGGGWANRFGDSGDSSLWCESWRRIVLLGIEGRNSFRLCAVVWVWHATKVQHACMLASLVAPGSGSVATCSVFSFVNSTIFQGHAPTICP